MPLEIQRNLIFDLGLHKGFDTEYYLAKGFDVVALEAAPDLCDKAAKRVSKHRSRCTIINKALFTESNQTVSFYTVPDKDDWGSLNQDFAEKGIEKSVEIKVDTISLSDLFKEYGVPYYIKCDLEGGDLMFLELLEADTRRPTFVSVEMSTGIEGESLRRCGYEKGQIVNQWMHPYRRAMDPPKEGKFVETAFHGEMSGPFGKELDPNKWQELMDIDDIYKSWIKLRMMDDLLAPGWVDLHVAHRSSLDES